MIKQFFTLLLGLFFIGASYSLHAQPLNPEGGLVHWMDIEQAFKEYQEFPKPILVDFYTDWCGWCKHMMKTTYSQTDLANYINSNYYPVKFNAEGKDTITWLGKKYIPTSDAPRTTHPWAMKMLNGSLSYPTTIFLNGFNAKDSAFVLNLVAPGYLDRAIMEPLLVFTLENVYRNASFDDFNKEFKIAFNDSLMNLRKEHNTWLTPKDFFKAGATQTKKSLVFISTGWCNSGRVMSKTSFSDPELFNYIDTTFNLIELNPEISDTLYYQGEVMINAHNQQAPFHQLAYYLTRNNMVIPSLVILDEKMMPLDIIPFYLPPKSLKSVTRYYGEGFNTKMTWQDFMTTNP